MHEYLLHLGVGPMMGGWQFIPGVLKLYRWLRHFLCGCLLRYRSAVAYCVIAVLDGCLSLGGIPFHSLA